MYFDFFWVLNSLTNGCQDRVFDPR